MFYKNLKWIVLSAILITTFFIPGKILAASFNLILDNPSGSIGNTFNADVKINSEGVGINAAQATIQFPKDILQVTGIDKTDSIFNFWLSDPSFDNNSGVISFVGGATSGFSGQNLQIFTIKFKVKGNGQANLAFTDGSINVSDGSGTNVLTAMRGAQFLAGVAGTLPSGSIAPPVPTAPVQITRTPAPAQGLPAKPELNVQLYPDPTKWYNIFSDFTVSWPLPLDISDVATVINKNPTSVPGQSEGLFDNKTFKAIDDGIWYLHVRFKNSIGWGPTAHYRIAIDTVPPVAFVPKIDEKSITDSYTTDNPAPTLTYESGDNLSGVDFYFVRIGDGDVIKVSSTTFTLPRQAPGKRPLIVGVQDKAGNITENFINLDILPIESPTLKIDTSGVFAGEGGLYANGSSLPKSKILFSVKTKDGQDVFSSTIGLKPDSTWEIKVDQPLKSGSYYVQATAQDERGALSLPVKSAVFKVSSKPILIIGGVGITQTWFFVGLLIILALGFLAGWFSVQLSKTQRGRKVIMAQRDVMTVLGLIRKNLDQALSKYADKNITANESSEIEFLLRHANENIDKMQKYILGDIQEISEENVSVVKYLSKSINEFINKIFNKK